MGVRPAGPQGVLQHDHYRTVDCSRLPDRARRDLRPAQHRTAPARTLLGLCYWLRHQQGRLHHRRIVCHRVGGRHRGMAPRPHRVAVAHWRFCRATRVSEAPAGRATERWPQGVNADGARPHHQRSVVPAGRRAGSVDGVQMAAHSAVHGRMTELTGRRSECDVLDRLVDAVRAGESRALVVAGEPGVGKTALLDHVAGRASGFRVARAMGVQSEMELAFAGLQQLCSPMLDGMERLPAPQRDALRTAFGVSAGPAPDRFLVGLAVLSLLAEGAGEQPLICLGDDQRWLEPASAQVLGFVARRLGAESVGLVFAARVPGGDLAGLPELVIAGLPEADARALLDSVTAGPLDERVRDRIVAETRGNPLALAEQGRMVRPAQLAGGFGLPGAAPVAAVDESIPRRVEALPAQTRRPLLVAAADPTRDPDPGWPAARRRRSRVAT